ncbi:ATP-binding protein, partial [bacterium]|nr:ATP-binding protein [candidate division CSSED10-310 bacterium]
DALVDEYSRLRRMIDVRKELSIDVGIALRLEHLKQLYFLSNFELTIVLICLAPELDLRYEKLYAYMQDDITKKSPTVAFALDVVCANLREKVEKRKKFQQSPIFINSLIKVIADSSRVCPSMLSSFLKIDSRIVEFLCDNDSIDLNHEHFYENILPQQPMNDLPIMDSVRSSIQSILNSITSSFKPILFLWGNSDAGMNSVAEAICTELGKMYILFKGHTLAESGTHFRALFDRVLMESKLRDAIILWENFNIMLHEERHSDLGDAITLMNQFDGIILLTSNTSWEPGALFSPFKFFSIHILNPSAKLRHELWTSSMQSAGVSSPVDELVHIAAMFRMNPRQIRDAAFTAVRHAFVLTGKEARPREQELLGACRIHSATKLGELAKKIKPHYQWSDIVLPHEKVMHLKELCGSMKYRAQVFEEWGFERKLSLGKGVHALFAGGSGTGKTMASEIIAHELGVDLYKVDLSTVVSKYIGETEKNLSRIFNEAENSNAILFFDEADALMGKRSEVKDAHDRYANIEISYLLQKMEEYNGMSLLATNLRQNIDDAFIRRIRFIIEFPFPERSYRLEIWRKVWPDDTPLSDDIDFNFLANQFELSGGNIRNIALNATFIAAEKGSKVTMMHILYATKREFQKTGKVCLSEDFGKYKNIAV